MPNLIFHNDFIFRSPAFPFQESITSEAKLKEIANKKEFQEAIYIASPVLFNEMQTWLKGEIKEPKEVKKIIYSLHKYYSRISSRCTPYGLFATCSTGHWGKENAVTLSESISLHARLDMDFVCSLSQHLLKHPAIIPYLLFYPNNSIYYVSNQVRFVRYSYIENKRVHNISSAIKSNYLIKTLESAKEGALLTHLGNVLIKDNIHEKDATNFVKELIDSQLLVSQLEPNITGKEFIFELISVLENMNKGLLSEEVNSIVQLLKNVNASLDTMGNATESTVHIYRQLFMNLNEILPDTKENNLFQVDSFRPVVEAQLNEGIKNTVSKTIHFIQKLYTPFINNDLNEFKKRFHEIHEGREIPLLEVLDTENGIGYPSKDNVGVNELVDDLPVQYSGAMEYQIKWNMKEELLLKKLFEAAKRDDYSITFSDNDVKDFRAGNLIFPATIYSILKVIDAANSKIQFIYASGSSAANILGRFAHGDKNILKTVKDITCFEKDIIEDKIIAEIVHLSESRVGNILLRPIFRDYEIPYLANSSLPAEFQIPLDDLLVSVKNNRVFLRSKRLNKEVLPHLSTAHNYSFNSLPVYKFLCDLQSQDITLPGVAFSWGALSKSFKFIPRAEYDKVILHPATWNFIKSDYENILKSIDTIDFIDKVTSWKKQWKMPRYISLKDADNELLVDLENELSIKVFLDTVKKRRSIELVEFLFDPETALVRDFEGNPYNNEVIAVLFNSDYKKMPSSLADRTMAINAPPKKRSFIPGSEWIYYKIYCGVKTADKILTETIKPLVEQLKMLNLIEKWFFIRYSDPDTHISASDSILAI